MPSGGYRENAGRPPNPNSKRQQRLAARGTGGRATRMAPPAGLDMLRLASMVPNLIAGSGARQTARRDAFNPYKLPVFPDRAMPPEGFRMAMDSNVEWASTAWAAGDLMNTGAVEGLLFPGYTYLSELAQRTEYRTISETIADDATRKWIMFDITGTEEEKEERQAEDFADPEGAEGRRKERLDAKGKTHKVRELMGFLDDLDARNRFHDLIVGDGLFGRMHLHLGFGANANALDLAELKTPIGNGRNELSKAKVNPQNPLRQLKVIEPVWTYPMAYNAVNPLLADWYNPQYWYVMGQELHCSRILPFISRPVPDILKPSYAFGGISLSQLAQPYVDIWLRTRSSIAELIHSFSVMVLSTNLETMTQPQSAASLLERVALFNTLRDNQGAFVVDKNTEELKNVSASLAGLHELQAQAQEHLTFPARIPLVKLTGIQPSGLNASSDGEIRVYYDTISSMQNRTVRPRLQPVVDFAMLSLWGEIDEDLTLEFEPLWEMSRKEEAELQKQQAERDKIFVDGGAISPEEWRSAIIGDPSLPYGGLNPEDVPEPPMPDDGGGGFGGEGDDPPLPSAKRPAPQASGAAEDAADDPFGAEDAGWKEGDHPRGQPGNAGQFGPGGGGPAGGSKGTAHEGSSKAQAGSSKTLKPTDLTKVGEKMGSNEGGTFEDKKTGKKFYVKKPASPAHVTNELLGAKLYQLAGGNTLDYHPVEGGKHVATEIAKLDKKNVNDFTPAEKKEAQKDFVTQAWLGNWDAAGTGGDNKGVLNGKPTALDFGGALEYRAHGEPKGDKFGPDATADIENMQDSSISPDNAQLYGGMKPSDEKESAKQVTELSNDAIITAVKEAGGTATLAQKLIDRKASIAKLYGQPTDTSEWDDTKHPRNPDGTFATGTGSTEPAAAPKGGEEDDDVPKPGAYGGLWKQGGSGSPVDNWATNVGTYINQAPQIGIHYRRMMAKLLKDADKFKADDGLKEKIKTKLVDSLWGSLAAAKKKGKQDEVVKIAKTIEKLTGKAPTPQTIAAPESKPTPAPAAKPSDVPQASPEDIAKAKKVTNVPMPPALASPVGNKLLEDFNKKYGTGTEPLTDLAALNQKVADFKTLQEKVKAAYPAYQAEMQEKAKASAKKQAEAIKAAQAASQAQIKQYMGEFNISEVEATGFVALVQMMGGSQTDFIQKFKKYESQAKGHGYPISGFQYALVRNYINGGYTKVNDALRAGSVSAAQHLYARLVNDALDKMPKYEGIVERGTSLTASQLAAYKPGHVVEERGFTSTGKGYSFGGNVRYKIKSIGRRAADFSGGANQGEQEVLFKAHTFFLVHKVETKGGTTHIEMEEVEGHG